MKKESLLERIQKEENVDYHAKEWELFKEKIFLEQYGDKEEDDLCQR